MNDIVTATDPRDALVAQLRTQNDLLQRKVNGLEGKLRECREKKAQALASRMTVSALQVVATAIDENDEQWEETLSKQADFWFYALIVEIMLREIDADAALFSGDELRQRVNAETSGDLLKFFRQASMVIDNQPIPDVKERVIAHDRAIHELVNNRDDGTLLRDLARSERGVARRIIEWRERFGAPKKPRPITAYVLEQVPYLRNLHSLPSDGASMEKMMGILKSRPDVKAWLQFKADNANNSPLISRKLTDQSVEVQVFERFDGQDREQLAESYKTMKKNNPNWRLAGG